MKSQIVNKADKAISECVDEALSLLSYVDKNEFYRRLKKDYNIKPQEIGQKIEAFNNALKKTFGIKQYAIQRQIMHILDDRAKAGIYEITDEAEAYLKISKVFLNDTEKQLTKIDIKTRLSDYTLRLRRLIEEDKANKEKLKASERLVVIGQTASMVGHDLRNPLQSIINELYLAKHEMNQLSEGETRRKMQESLDFIYEQTLYMDKVVSDLQTFAKDIVARKETFNLNRLLDSTLAQVVVPENVETFLEVDEDFSLKTDPELLKRALTNLVNNAIQAMPEGGKLTIRACDNCNDVSIFVEDTGEGVPEEVKPKLFSPLFTTKAKGQGFGLAAVKKITEALGGSVSFESEVGKGTIFILTIPSD